MKTIKCICGKDLLVDDHKAQEVSANMRFCRWSHRGRFGESIAFYRSQWINVTTLIKGTPPPGLVWDHEDGNIHNIQESNLRPATRSQNCRNKVSTNSTGYRYVKFYRGRHKAFQAVVAKDGVKHSAGYFYTAEAAARAGDALALSLHGPSFTILNFPISSQSSDATGAATVSAANGMETPSINLPPPPVEGVQSTI